MPSWNSSRLVLCTLLVAAYPALGAAQEMASSLDQLRVLVKPGDTVIVTDDTGRQSKGRIATLSPASLDVVVDGNLRSFSEGNLRTIQQRRPDSLRNGALWGLGAGAAFGAIGFVESAELGVGGMLVYGGIGAGIGVGIDALISGKKMIFFNPKRATGSPAVTLRPVMTGGRTGVTASLSF